MYGDWRFFWHHQFLIVILVTLRMAMLQNVQKPEWLHFISKSILNKACSYVHCIL